MVDKTEKKSTGKYWMLFVLSLVFMAAMWIFIPEYSSLSLALVLTSFVKAMDII